MVGAFFEVRRGWSKGRGEERIGKDRKGKVGKYK
jgi:hypothetical protein